jgi:hypothetical protein
MRDKGGDWANGDANAQGGPSLSWHEPGVDREERRILQVSELKAFCVSALHA